MWLGSNADRAGGKGCSLLTMFAQSLKHTGPIKGNARHVTVLMSFRAATRGGKNFGLRPFGPICSIELAVTEPSPQRVFVCDLGWGRQQIN